MNRHCLLGRARSSSERHAGASVAAGWVSRVPYEARSCLERASCLVAASPCREIPTGKIQKNGLRGQHAAHYDGG